MATGTVTFAFEPSYLEKLQNRKAPTTKVRAGVDKGRPISSVADSVKKFSVGSPETKRAAATSKPKPTTQKPSLETKPTHTEKSVGAIRKTTATAKPAEAEKKAQTATKREKQTIPAKPAKPAVAENKPKSGSFERTTPTKKLEIQSTKMEKPLDKETVDEEKKTDVITEVKVAPAAEQEPVIKREPSPEVTNVVNERDIPEKSQSPEPSAVEEPDPTRALKVISMFEQKANKQEAETPPWKKHLKQRESSRERDEKEGSAEPNETAKPVITRVSPAPVEQSPPPPVEEPPKEKPISNGELSKSLETPSPSSQGKDEPDGAIFSVPRRLKDSSSLSKSTSVLSSNTSDEVKLRDKKEMTKVSSQSNIADDIKKNPFVDAAKSKRSSWMPSKREECAACGKVVYAMERLEADKVVYHKTCFKCITCNKTLSTGNYAALQGKTYCKTHFKQLFKMKGNYDEGFGREQHKTKWIKKDSESTSTSNLNGH